MKTKTFKTMEEVNLWLMDNPQAHGCLKAYKNNQFVLFPEVEAPRIEGYFPDGMVYKGIVHADILTEKEALSAKKFRRNHRST